jgi:PAS domain S-box-containing protein
VADTKSTKRAVHDLPLPSHATGEKYMSKATILIVEDDAILAIYLQGMITNMGYTVAGVLATGEEAVDFLHDQHVDLVIMDIELAGAMNGITAAATLHKTSDVPIVFLTGFSHDPLLEQAKIARPYGYLIKPVNERELAVTLQMALHRHMFDKQLKESRLALLKSEELFRRTFDQSPIGAAIVGLDYTFVKVNQELCKITGYSSKELEKMSFTDITFADDLAHDLQQAHDLSCGLIDQYQMIKRYIRKDGQVIWIRLSVRLIRNEQQEPLYFLPMVEDINEQKMLEEEKNIIHILLKIVNEDSDLKNLLQATISFFKSWTEIDGIGIRLRQGDDFPYFTTVGFPKEFVQQENSLCSIDKNGNQMTGEQGHTLLTCMCGHVISGLMDISSPFFTASGSFCTNNTTHFLSQCAHLQMQPGMRFHCHKAGYESLLLVPLRTGGNTLGLLQFNNKERNRYSKQFISLMERLADHISVAVAQRLTEENLKAKQMELEEMNAALKVLLRNRENDLAEHDQSLLINIRQLVFPCIERLKLGSLDRQQMAQLSILESNLETITSSFAKQLASPDIALTPGLIQVADLIKKGISNKEIAALLGISVKSVETYRKRIRHRLNLKNSKQNLRAYLLNM